MRYLGAILKVVLFLLLFAFAMRNADMIELHGLLGGILTAPLAVVLFFAFLAGVAAGVAAMLLHMTKVKRELTEARRQLRNNTERAEPEFVERVDLEEPLEAIV